MTPSEQGSDSRSTSSVVYVMVVVSPDLITLSIESGYLFKNSLTSLISRIFSSSVMSNDVNVLDAKRATKAMPMARPATVGMIKVIKDEAINSDEIARCLELFANYLYR